MGDPRRNHVFADFIIERWDDPSTRIADVAGGHGHLNAALYRHGYRHVVTFDKRRKRWGRPNYVYGTFGPHVSRQFDLVVGMHPDDATDVLMAWAIARRLPFAVVPCCIRPQAWEYDGPRDQTAWIDHLADKATSLGYAIERPVLAMRGANRVLVGLVGRGASERS